MMHTLLCSPTDHGTCAGLSRWGTAPSCVSGSMDVKTTAFRRLCANPEAQNHLVPMSRLQPADL
eukprot:2233042-Prymnesium_polylepis.1